MYHSYANAVSVRRLGYNDHGPVHARLVTYNALKILRLMHEHIAKGEGMPLVKLARHPHAEVV